MDNFLYIECLHFLETCASGISLVPLQAKLKKYNAMMLAICLAFHIFAGHVAEEG